MAVGALRWHWVPGLSWSRRVLPGVRLSSRVPPAPQGPRTAPYPALGTGCPRGDIPGAISWSPPWGHWRGWSLCVPHCLSWGLCSRQRSAGRVLPRAQKLNSAQLKRDRGLCPLPRPALPKPSPMRMMVWGLEEPPGPAAGQECGRGGVPANVMRGG